jgi:hypothetical protein
MKIKPECTRKKQGGTTKWAKGQSGNIKGKPRGSLNKVTLAIQSLLDGEGEALTRKAIELAKDGDLTAIKLCLDRILPPRKSRTINVDLPAVDTCAGVSQAQAVIVRVVAEGEITPDEGSTLSSILEARRKSIETNEHEARLSRLEGLEK